jgi:uncharacterized membrane protein YhhN
MPPLGFAGASVTAVALVGLLAAEHKKHRATIWVAKPLASLGFLLAAVGAGAAAPGYGRGVLVGLVLCWLGDVLLIPKAKPAFLAGLGSFLAGHVAFAWAFFERGIAPATSAVALAAITLPVVGVWRWLAPHVGAGMRVPVIAYISVIAIMVSTAFGTHALLPIAGAVAFMVSDVAVARDRFVAPGFTNRAWGLPLYYAAVLILAFSTA